MIMENQQKNERLHISNFLYQEGPLVEVIESIVSKIDDSEIGFAGFGTKDDLKGTLVQEMQDSGGIFKTDDFKKYDLLPVIERAIARCHKVVFIEKTNVFLFPTLSKFVKEKMMGVTGFTPWKNTIHVYVGAFESDWESVIAGTIFHEYCHAVMLNFHEWNTNLDTLIFEGMAELFREENSESYNPLWISVFSEDEGKKIFAGLLRNLDNRGALEDEKLPLWTKYTLGYQIVKNFRNKNKNIVWKDLVRMSPQEIFDGSGYEKLGR
jgi:hypothetical protein